MSDKSADSIIFSNLSDAVLSLAQGIWPEIGAYYVWRRGTIRLMIYFHYLSGGEVGWHRIPHAVLGPKLRPRASVESAIRNLRRDLDGAEEDFNQSGFWPVNFKRGKRELYDESGNRTNNPAKADHRKTKYIDTVYAWTEPGGEIVQLIRQSVGDVNLMARGRINRLTGFADIIKTVCSHHGKPIIPDKTPKKKKKAEPEPEKDETESKGITLTRALYEVQQMPRTEQVQFSTDFAAMITGHLISDSQDYSEGAHIFTKMQTAVSMGQHQLSDLRQRITKYNGAQPSTAGARGAEMRFHMDEASTMLAKCEQLTTRAELAGLTEVADYWRRWADSLRDLRWAINADRKSERRELVTNGVTE